MAKELHVELVAAERKVWSGQAYVVIAKTTEGELGIMPGHAPVFSVLVTGPVTIRTVGGGSVVAAVHGGFLSVADDNVSVLAEVAELSEEIDVSRAEAALERVRTRAEGDEEATGARQRAEARLRAAGAR